MTRMQLSAWLNSENGKYEGSKQTKNKGLTENAGIRAALSLHYHPNVNHSALTVPLFHAQAFLQFPPNSQLLLLTVTFIKDRFSIS